MDIGKRMWIRAGLKQSKPLIIIKNRLFNVGGLIMREYDISEDGIMVLCRACERYLDLLQVIQKKIIRSLQMSELMSGKMKEPLEKILEYFKDNTEITNAIGQELTGKSTAQVRRYLNALCDVGIIKSNKGTKGNVYLKK